MHMLTLPPYVPSNFVLAVQFMKAAGQEIGPSPSNPSPDTIRLRRALIAEEYFELMGCMAANGPVLSIAKELADLLYVVYGTAAAYGINIDDVFAEVHVSNMTKLDRDNPERDAHGKILKSSTYIAPDILMTLKRQTWPLDLDSEVTE